ncbi:MAG: hypothetical protein R2695_15785 [Acidimicrobiales bacterium]
MSEQAFVNRQRSFDDLGTALHEVTFVVLDLETTGGSPADCAITEVGGEATGRRMPRHLPDARRPRLRDPTQITLITGISQAMVLRATYRRRAAVPPRVRRRHGDRRAQHPLRHRLPRCRAARPTTGHRSPTGRSTPSRSPGACC